MKSKKAPWLVLPAQQKAIFDSKVDPTDKQVEQIKEWLDNYLPWFNPADLKKALTSFTDRAVKRVKDLNRKEADTILDHIESNPESFATEFAGYAGYSKLFPGRVRGTYTKKRNPTEVLETPEDYYDRIRTGGGIYIPKEGVYGKSDVYTEWSEDMSHGKKTVLGSRDQNSKTLDEWADQFGLSPIELLDKLEKATPVKERKSEEELEKELQERELRHEGMKEAIREMEEEPVEPEVDLGDVEITGEPGEGSRFKKVQDIYEQIIENETGQTRSEIMRDAWRLWRDWAGKEKITEGEDVVPFYPGKPEENGKSSFFGHDVFVYYPKQAGVWTEEKRKEMEEKLSQAMSDAHGLWGEDADTWNEAIRMAYVDYNLYKPMQWITDRAWEVFRQYYPQDWERSVHHAWYEWATQQKVNKPMEDPIND